MSFTSIDLARLAVTGGAGLEAGRVEIALDDGDNAIGLPRPGAPLAVFPGWPRPAPCRWAASPPAR